jgi:nitrogen fixation NifU-like protein
MPQDANRRCGRRSALCGDHIVVLFRVEAEVIKDAGFESLGCALCRASASFMTETLKGRTVDGARQLFHAFEAMIRTGEIGAECAGDLAAFAAVRGLPSRIECVLLPWRAAMEALDQGDRQA